MNKHAVYHEPKSKYSYAFDKNTLHLRLRTQKDDVSVVKLTAGDPFNWFHDKVTGEYHYDFSKLVSKPMIKEYSDEIFDYWFCAVDEITSLRIRYCFILDDMYLYNSLGLIPFNPEHSVTDFKYSFNFPFINEEDVFSPPSWVAKTVWYQIFPHSFGGFKGIIAHLDYIAALGVNGIYLTPVFEAPTKHKYDTTDYFNIDPEFGNNELFGEFMKAAHKRGIKVMLDAVFNHCGYNHPFFQDVLKNGKASKYAECFHLLDDPNDPLGYRAFSYVKHMPKWNTNSKTAREYLINIGKFWAEKYGIDGWRLDVSNEVSHDFWREFRREMKAINPEFFIMGENWDNSYPWLMGDQFDSVMNYAQMNAIWSFVCADGYDKVTKADAPAFVNMMVQTLLFAYTKNTLPVLFNMNDSHDTERLLTVCGGNAGAARLAYVLQMTLTGSPSIYYGGEIGMAGAMKNDDNRLPMVWDEEKQDLTLLADLKKLIALRKRSEDTRSTDLNWLHASGGSLSYKKGKGLYVFLNNSASPATLPLPSELQDAAVRDEFNGVNIETAAAVTLPAYEFAIYNSNN